MMSKAQQAAEDQYPALQPDAEELTYPRSALRDFQRGAFISGWEQALPEEPDPAVIEAMAKGMYSEALPGRSWDRCPEDVKQHWRRYARAAYSALRGAMQ